MSVDKNLITGAIAHGVMRTISVVLVLGALTLPSWYFYNRGYKRGYAGAIKDRPTYGQVGTVVNNSEEPFKIMGITFNVWKLRLRLGL